MATQFRRTDEYDGASEILTVVHLESGCLAIQVTTGPEIGDDFAGLYDLDGEQIGYVGGFEVAEDVPADVASAIEENWATGNRTVERL